MKGKLKSQFGFDLISPFYDFSKRLVYGRKIDLIQTLLFNITSPFGDQLIIGGGTGNYLLNVLRYEASKSITYLDLSSRMIHLSKEKVHLEFPQKAQKIEYLVEPVQHFQTLKKYDCIHVPFILDCLNETDLRATLQVLKRSLKKDGLLYFSDFYSDERSSQFHLFHIKTLYSLFNLFIDSKRNKLPDFELEFKNNGFEVLQYQLSDSKTMQAMVLTHRKTE